MIIESLNKYAMKIESIILQNNIDNKMNNVTAKTNSIADEISKLVILKNNGAFSDEEFNALKSNLLIIAGE